MLVSRIQEFLNLLNNTEQQVSRSDAALIEQMRLKFSNLSPNLPLTEEDIHELLVCYSARAKEVVDSRLDYTFNLSSVNEPWVELALDLGRHLKRGYLEILIPDTKFDPDNLSKISTQSPSGIFLGDDDQTWHSVEAIIKHWKLSGLLATRNVPKDTKRPLSIKELYRLQSKEGKGLSFNFGNKQYDSFWDYLLKEVAPSWKKTDECSSQLQMALLDVLNNAHGQDPKQLRFALLNLQAEINNCNLKQASNFYGLKFTYQDKPLYLFEMLVACWKNDTEMEAKLAPVAQWLSIKNPAFISTSPGFNTAYEEIKAGPYFNLSLLSEALDQLDCRPYAHVGVILQQLKEKLKGKTTIDAEVVEQITTLYRVRWNSIIDATYDYMRLTSDVNKAWITLAQKLAGAGLINRNYYRLLIPTLVHDTDPITATHLTAYPLTSFILAEDGTQLILLSNCVNHHKAHGTFFNCNPPTPVPLTSKEEQRLRPNTEFYDYFLRVERGKPDPAIKKGTVDALIKLINGALYPRGLLYGEEYTGTQSYNAETAYGNFSEFVSKLPGEEFKNLCQQRILWHGARFTVTEILSEIQKGQTDVERECVAVYTKHLAKLVCDYNPNAELKQFNELKDMRANSARKVYREYNDISDDEATRRVLTIMVSLMTHQFNCALAGGHDVFLWDSSNSVTKSGGAIFTALEDTLKSGAAGMRFVYSSLLENTIIPALAKRTDSLFTSMVRYTDTNDWLKGIENGSLFNTNPTCFDPKVLIIVLSEIISQKTDVRKNIDNFIEEVLHTLAQEQNNYLIWIRVNIKLTEFLARLGPPREEILSKLRSNLASPTLFYEKTLDFLLYKCVYHKLKNQHGAFFTPDVNNGVQELKNKLGEVKFSEMKDLSFIGVLKKIRELVNANPETRLHKLFLDEYIERKLTPKIPEKTASAFALYA